MEAKLITTDGRVIPIAGTRKILIIDEEGKLKDKPTVNVLATNLAHEHKAISYGNSIVGNAILCDDTMID